MPTQCQSEASLVRIHCRYDLNQVFTLTTIDAGSAKTTPIRDNPKPILDQSENSSAHKRGTSVLQGPTEVSQGRTTSHAVVSIQRLIPPSIRCQSCANPMSINCKSDANPISIRVIPRQPSINPRQIRRQSKANNPPILTTGASIRCQSSANLMPIQ